MVIFAISLRFLKIFEIKKLSKNYLQTEKFENFERKFQKFTGFSKIDNLFE